MDTKLDTKTSTATTRLSLSEREPIWGPQGLSPIRKSNTDPPAMPRSLPASKLAVERIVCPDVPTVHHSLRLRLGDGIATDGLRVHVDVVTKVGGEHTIAIANDSLSGSFNLL